MLVVGFRGRDLEDTDPILRAIAEEGLGGVILFGRNIESPSQLRDLTSRLRAAATDRTLLICIDQEGGSVARLGPDKGFAATPTAANVGSRGDAGRALDVGRAMGETLSAAHINVNLAPVVDVNVNPDNPSIGALGRSYSADRHVVAEMAGAFIDGQHEENLLTTLKHFPGLGSATGNTDSEYVDVTETWTPAEMDPFRQLISSGRADVIMVANALNGQLDPDYPASLSATTVAVLRNDLGWDGPVITDDLGAGALRQSYEADEILRLAVSAGADLLLLANTRSPISDPVTPTLDMLVRMVEAGQIDEALIDRAGARIDGLTPREEVSSTRGRDTRHP